MISFKGVSRFFGMNTHEMTIRELNATWWRRLLLCLVCIALGFGLLAGCDSDGRSKPTGNSPLWVTYYKHCVEGVTYLRVDRGLSVQLDRDGKVIPCR